MFFMMLLWASLFVLAHLQCCELQSAHESSAISLPISSLGSHWDFPMHMAKLFSHSTSIKKCGARHKGWSFALGACFSCNSESSSHGANVLPLPSNTATVPSRSGLISTYGQVSVLTQCFRYVKQCMAPKPTRGNFAWMQGMQLPM